MHLSIWQSPPWVGLQGSKCCHIRWATNFSLCARLKHNGVVSLGSDCLFSNFHWVLLSCTSYRAGYWHTAYLTSHVRRWKMPCPTCPSTSTTDVFAHLHDQCVADSTPLKYLQGFRSKARAWTSPRSPHLSSLPQSDASMAFKELCHRSFHLAPDLELKKLAANTINKMLFCSFLHLYNEHALFEFRSQRISNNWLICFFCDPASSISVAYLLRKHFTVRHRRERGKQKQRKNSRFFAAWKNGKQSRNPQKQHQIAWVVPILKEMEWIYVVPILVRISN